MMNLLTPHYHHLPLWRLTMQFMAPSPNPPICVLVQQCSRGSRNLVCAETSKSGHKGTGTKFLHWQMTSLLPSKPASPWDNLADTHARCFAHYMTRTKWCLSHCWDPRGTQRKARAEKHHGPLKSSKVAGHHGKSLLHPDSGAHVLLFPIRYAPRWPKWQLYALDPRPYTLLYPPLLYPNIHLESSPDPQPSTVLFPWGLTLHPHYRASRKQRAPNTNLGCHGAPGA